MRLLVLGGSGRLGREVVGQSLGHRHDVTALFRDERDRETVDARAQLVVGDVTDSAVVTAAVESQDAVISTLGSRGVRPVHVYSDGIANTIRAMAARGIPRIVVTSAAQVGDHSSLPLRLRLRASAPGANAVTEDLERMEGDLQLSDLDWTIVRAPTLTDGELTGVYRVVEGGAVPGGQRISRADLAALLLKCAESGRYVRATVAAAY